MKIHKIAADRIDVNTKTKVFGDNIRPGHITKAVNSKQVGNRDIGVSYPKSTKYYFLPPHTTAWGGRSQRHSTPVT